MVHSHILFPHLLDLEVNLEKTCIYLKKRIDLPLIQATHVFDSTFLLNYDRTRSDKGGPQLIAILVSYMEQGDYQTTKAVLILLLRGSKNLPYRLYVF